MSVTAASARTYFLSPWQPSSYRTHAPNQALQPPAGSHLPCCTPCCALKLLALKTPFSLLHRHTQRRRYARSYQPLRRALGLHCAPQEPRQVKATINTPVLSSNSTPCAASQPRPALVGQSLRPHYGHKSNLACSASGGAFRGPKRLHWRNIISHRRGGTKIAST